MDPFGSTTGGVVMSLHQRNLRNRNTRGSRPLRMGAEPVAACRRSRHRFVGVLQWHEPAYFELSSGVLT